MEYRAEMMKAAGALFGFHGGFEGFPRQRSTRVFRSGGIR